jgi:hypothetical protein
MLASSALRGFRHVYVWLIFLGLMQPSLHACKTKQNGINDGKKSPIFAEPVEWAGPVFSNLKVNLSDGKPCEINLVVKQAFQAQLQLLTLSATTFSQWNLELHSQNSRGPIVEPVSTASPQSSTYRLLQGDYSILLIPIKGIKTTSTGDKTHELAFSDLHILSPPILQPNSSLLLRLDAYTRFADCKFSVSTRSELWIDINVPETLNKDEAGDLKLALFSSDARIEPTIQERYGSGLRFYFVILPSEYIARISLEVNEWPQPALPQRVTASDLGIRIHYLADAPLDPRLRPLADWLESLGLGNKIQILDLYSANVPRGGDLSAHLKAYYKKVFNRVTKEATGLSIDGFPTRQKENISREPDFLILFRSLVPREDIWAIENNFADNTGQPFWDHVLRKVSLVLGVPTSKVAAFIPVWCDPSVVYEDSLGHAERFGLTCDSGSAQREFKLPKTALARSGETSNSQIISLKEPIHPFFKSFLPAEAKLEFLENSDDGAEIIVRNIRGQVVTGGREWEKINIAAFIIPISKDIMKIRIIVDGLLSSGLGAYPPDSQFTTSMEPAHAQNLTEYAQKLATALSSFLEDKSK